MSAADWARRKEDLVCPMHGDMERKIGGIEDRLGELADRVTELRVAMGRMIGGLLVAQVVIIPMVMVILKQMKII